MINLGEGSFGDFWVIVKMKGRNEKYSEKVKHNSFSIRITLTSRSRGKLIPKLSASVNASLKLFVKMLHFE